LFTPPDVSLSVNLSPGAKYSHAATNSPSFASANVVVDTTAVVVVVIVVVVVSAFAADAFTRTIVVLFCRERVVGFIILPKRVGVVVVVIARTTDMNE
jgi:hypothetical protein